MQVQLIPTAHKCWKCGSLLNRLVPEVDGWCYHCLSCQHLTCPEEQLRHLLGTKTAGSIGFVASVPRRIDVVAETQPGEGAS